MLWKESLLSEYMLHLMSTAAIASSCGSWSVVGDGRVVFDGRLQVDKQEKKKKKTGRAKRRLQYNRRFVNVVATFGRKRGPNSNTQ